ncbi:MAG: hypothetical protein K9J37_03880 [Saprospiraceae bacterium]|nr:hypothetical protein [Saprospiraceae bacterium]MCF8249024.1 hypothetical protein [Saprospiraceae bacterium]MCF8282418.1 hypothetical protein [Bacteroidales bacterium]MCF8310918.1 hypothetical protein [Saprospiraceae bacterium]MCF8439494.1 hypothetical protein [Saprospiraceae bacterium]
MRNALLHKFHIPVMGIGFTIDTPIKVARFGISSVISIVEDELIERMRKFHSQQADIEYVPIKTGEEDYRAKRITAYLNLIHDVVQRQTEQLRRFPFEQGTEIVKYFELLPDDSPAKKIFTAMIELEDGRAKVLLQKQLRTMIAAGSIDVNIMSKLDKVNYEKNGEPLPTEYSDGHAALRGFAMSKLNASVIFSAGFNPRLYAYIETFSDFLPDINGKIKKKIILKVSDYRSAITQGKLLAKKGLWVSEYRIESGLNCGGHAFATDGLLLGPILEEFKNNRPSLLSELLTICNNALAAKGLETFTAPPEIRVSVQGGIGTANENSFLLEHYQTDSTGWGSPFLLVPEATEVDEKTLQQLATAKKEDYYLSNASPLGIPFNNFKKSTSEEQRKARIAKGRPGSPCYKKFLSSNTEFTEIPICTASRQYQELKIKQLEGKNLPTDLYEKEYNNIIDKDCLCEGLGASALLKEGLEPSHKLTAVAICPGPNLAYFSGIFSLKQMVDHIYGRINLLNSVPRSNMFVNELNLYLEYLKNESGKYMDNITTQQSRYLRTFQTNLMAGIEYYRKLATDIKQETSAFLKGMTEELKVMEGVLLNITIPLVAEVK